MAAAPLFTRVRLKGDCTQQNEYITTKNGLKGVRTTIITKNINENGT